MTIDFGKFFGRLFARRTPVFRKKDRAGWEAVKEALAAEGIDCKAGHYNGELLFGCGCGAKIDPRNHGRNGTIDREVYFVEVREEHREAALAALAQRGLRPEVEERPTMDAAERLRQKERENLKYFSRQPPRA